MPANHIVVIEDNPADTLLLRNALDEQGDAYTLTVLTDGETALDYIREQCIESEPCLIIVDLHLPKYDGITILRAIRAEPELASVKVVVLTSIATPAERAEIQVLGVAAYRTKPLLWEDTVDLARDLMAICKEPRGAAATSASS